MTSRRLLTVAVSLAVCCFGVGLVWSQGATSATQKAAPPAFLPSRELEELDRVVQARFAVVPNDGFGFSRMVPPGGYHGQFYPASKTETDAVSALKRTHQQVAFFLVGRKGTTDKFRATERVQGPVIMPSRVWRTKAEFPAAQAAYKDVVAKAPGNAQLCKVADDVFAGVKAADIAHTQVKEWHIVARPIEASSEACVTCHNSMAKRAAESAQPPLEKPDLVSLHDTLGVALYCVRTTPKNAAHQEAKQEQTAR